MASIPQNPALSATRALDMAAAATVVLLCLSWGFNQVAVKLAIPDIPPLMQASIRSAGAGLIVWLWTRARGIPLHFDDGSLRAGLITGLLFGLEFVLIYRGLLFTTASRAVLFLYMAPFLVVLGSHWLVPGDRFTPSQWAGLALSFAGIAVAFGIPSGADSKQMIGDLMLLGGGATWAATTLMIKSSALNRVSAEKTMLYQLVVSIPILTLGAVLFGERITHAPGALAIGSLLYQTVWVVSITFVIWFALIVRYSASRLSAFTFLTPLFGVAAGYLVMGDPITPGFALAVMMVIGGLVLVNRPR
jgi:drug/metabolite transporter (DMT)-like permease